MAMSKSSSATVIDRRFDELSTVELHDLIRLRCDVFVVEQACIYPELDGRDTEPGTRHVWIPGNDTPIAAYARCLTNDAGISRIGRVVTAPARRGDGLAAHLVTHLVNSIDGEVILDAQTYLLKWYERLGFERSGSDFVEDGIPHTPMRFSGPKNPLSP